jgi:hypothetical protein
MTEEIRMMLSILAEKKKEHRNIRRIRQPLEWPTNPFKVKDSLPNGFFRLVG